MGVVGGWCWPKSPLSPVVSSQELEALGSPTAPPHVEQRPLEEEVSQQQTAPRSSKDSLTTGRPPAWPPTPTHCWASLPGSRPPLARKFKKKKKKHRNEPHVDPGIQIIKEEEKEEG